MRRRLTLLALGATVLLAGCAFRGDEEAATSTRSGNDSTLLADAAVATAHAESSRVFVEASVGGQSFTGEGAYDYGADRGNLTLDLAPLGAGLGEVQLVFADHVVYYRLPAGMGLLAGGKSWVRIDPEALGKASETNLDALAQGNQTDPGQYLRWLKATGADVEEIGTESVRGVETTHYRASVDLDKVVETAAPEVRGATKAWIDRLKSELDSDEVPIDVWVDGDGLVRRIQQDYELRGTKTEITLELYDFGVEVDAEAPPADDVVDLDDFLEGGFGS